MEEKSEFEVKWEDRSHRLPAGGTYLDVKKAMGWKNDVLMVCDGEEAKELRSQVGSDCSVTPLTFNDERARRALRHTASHILAQAVKRLFPEVKLGIGPAIEDGFYYDFDVNQPFSPEDLEKIEAEMKRIVDQNLPVTREEVDRDTARRLFGEKDEPDPEHPD